VGTLQVPVPVISVGNITTGGTGKTPVVAWIAELLLAAGHRPAIAMRGYGATAGRPADEQAEHESRQPEVPVVAHPDRHAALSAFLPDHPEIDCVVLDDGFQHRRLRRDLDLVLVDATAGTMRDRLLPRGNLREPTASLRRADAVIITHAGSVDPALAAAVAALHGREPLAWCRPEWTALRVMDEEGERACDPDWLSGRRVLTLLGVARPDRVRRQLVAAGAAIAADVPARDHERFDVAKLTVARGLCDGVDAMVMTGKDWVRARDLIDLSRWPAPIVVPELRVEFLAGAGALRERILAALPRRR
jgi:tetraacyldisaccharide 4'-kinase